ERASLWGATDLHVSPEPDAFSVRFRLDGVLEPVARLRRERFPLLVQRIKVLAGLLTYRTDTSQDGRVARDANPTRCDLRVSVVPTLHGEKAVIRLLGASHVPERIDGLGFPGDASAALEDAFARPQGLVLFTGPAGSGKTTTIYAGLREVVARGKRSCVSIEEPVEATIAGVDQTPVDRAAGLDFPAALRALLRQDPEVIFVGEVRDRETARTAVEAGLTGHLVITTLHAGSAPEAVARLVDLGVEPFALASSLARVFAQRLLRRRCCEGGACCRGTGYRGRFPIVEHLATTPALRAAILERASAERLTELARADGAVALATRAQEAVSKGLTTAEEVARVLGGAPSPSPREAGGGPGWEG
ncbi:MAG TPA: GspE/PulE family protein, partial [Planctomycetota bacterium]|nr:GspE/PulE family protein [Planctomycetota bacterium]